jgi:hypothetical protein
LAIKEQGRKSCEEVLYRIVKPGHGRDLDWSFRWVVAEGSETQVQKG